MKMNTVLFGFPGNEELTRKLLNSVDFEIGDCEMRTFPDGESYLRNYSNVAGKKVWIVCTLDRPNTKILPLLFFAKTVKAQGAVSVGLVAPYLAYMRQDKIFNRGEGITSKYFADLICGDFDEVLTVDPHLHRFTNLSDLYSIATNVLHAAGVIAAWIKENVPNALVIGPDSESAQWVSEVAKLAQTPYLVMEKERKGDRDVTVFVHGIEKYAEHVPVLVDDIISTGRTMIETVQHLLAKNMPAPICIGVHAVFADEAYEDLLNSGVQSVVTTTTIPHPSNGIDLLPLFAGHFNSVNLEEEDL